MEVKSLNNFFSFSWHGILNKMLIFDVSYIRYASESTMLIKKNKFILIIIGVISY